MTQNFSLAQMIDEVRFELNMRSSTYPSRIHRKLMRQSEADYHVARMKAVLATLEELQRQESK